MLQLWHIYTFEQGCWFAQLQVQQSRRIEIGAGKLAGDKLPYTSNIIALPEMSLPHIPCFFMVIVNTDMLEQVRKQERISPLTHRIVTQHLIKTHMREMPKVPGLGWIVWRRYMRLFALLRSTAVCTSERDERLLFTIDLSLALCVCRRDATSILIHDYVGISHRERKISQLACQPEADIVASLDTAPHECVVKQLLCADIPLVMRLCFLDMRSGQRGDL